MHVSDYLLKRIEQLGVQHILGVPGDFNLTFLDYVLANKSLQWMGMCNELNAAYACDGYYRVRGLPGVLVTTYGVGELSALNGISGAAAERVPMLHIVGSTTRVSQDEHWLLHHTNPGNKPTEPVDHSIYIQTSTPFSCAQELLQDPSKVAEQIDHVIEQIMKTSLPGYIFLPMDIVAQEVPNAEDRLKNRPLDFTLKSSANVDDDTLVNEILELLYAAEFPILLADTNTKRFGAQPLTQKFMKSANIYGFTTALGKGSLDETEDLFVGTYNGKISLEGIADAVENKADLIIQVGPLLSDGNTGGFSRSLPDEKVVFLSPDYVKIRGKNYAGAHFIPILKKLLAKLDSSKLKFKPTSANKPVVEPFGESKSSDITQTQLVTDVSKFVKDNDVVFIESSCFQYNSFYMQFAAKNVTLATQMFYSSIGYTLPAALGAAVARRELGIESSGRVLLFEGDGSSLMTIQEIATLIRFKLPITILLMNNSGYSIERAIWGPKQLYNDIPDIKWTQLLAAFGGAAPFVMNYSVKNAKEFKELLTSGKLDDPSTLNFVEIVMDKFDYSKGLETQVQFLRAKNTEAITRYCKEFQSKSN